MDFELSWCTSTNKYTLVISKESIQGAERTVVKILSALPIFTHISMNEYAIYCEINSQDSYKEEYKRIAKVLELITDLLILT